MSEKIKRKTPLKKTKLAKTFDYEEKLGIPNPYDKGKFGVKGNVKRMNVKTRKKYEKVKDLLRVLDLEADLGKQEKFNKGGYKKNKKEEISKKIDKMMGFPMDKIDKLIKQAKDLNKPKKRFDKGGSHMAKKNFSSKELMMKSQYAQKNTKPKKIQASQSVSQSTHLSKSLGRWSVGQSVNQPISQSVS